MRALYGEQAASSNQLPPYGREVMAALDAGEFPNVRLYACRPDPWTPARKHRDSFGTGTAMVFPVDANPDTIQWPPLRNIVVNITGLPGGALHELARALVRDGCRLAYLLDADHPERSLRVVAKRGDV